MYGFMYPPRPEKAIPPELIAYYQSEGFIAQVKKNGTCTVIAVAPDHSLNIWTRHGERHKAWKPDPESPSLRAFKKLPKRWFVFVGELLHSKGVGIKDTLYLFDILVDGKSLMSGCGLQSPSFLGIFYRFLIASLKKMKA